METSLQRSNLVRLFGDQFLYSFVIVLIQGAWPSAARFVDKSIEA
jgi:hypothetical protein